MFKWNDIRWCALNISYKKHDVMIEKTKEYKIFKSKTVYYKFH